MAEQMETWKRLLEVERSYNKESDDVITEVREMEQRTQREVGLPVVIQALNSVHLSLQLAFLTQKNLN